MADDNSVTRLLANRFGPPSGSPGSKGEIGRIVFWRDDKGQYGKDVDSYVGENAEEENLRDVTLVRIGTTPFTLRYRMMKQEPTARFLVYMEGDQPLKQEDDWLLDLKLAYGPVFSADRLTLILNERFPKPDKSDMGNQWLAVMKRTPKFFDSKTRVNDLVNNMKPCFDENDLQAQMIAVVLGIKGGQHTLQSIWKRLLANHAKNDDSGIKTIENLGLAEFHWNGTEAIYHFHRDTESDSLPTVDDFVIWLFRLAWNSFVGEEGERYYANIRKDFEDWCNSKDMTSVLKDLSKRVAGDLAIAEEVRQLPVEKLRMREVFREVDEQLIVRLYEGLSAHTMTPEQVREAADDRGMGLWADDAGFKAQYACLKAAAALRQAIRNNEPAIHSFVEPGEGIELYTKRLYAVDQAYRVYCRAWNTDVREGAQTLERTWHTVDADSPSRKLYDQLQHEYDEFENSLAQAWQKRVNELDRWKFEGVPAQSDFFEREVRPFLDKNQKVAVIISDALRYEVADELMRRLNQENRYLATLGYQYSVLPSYTQLGMAALLPHKDLSLDAAPGSSSHYYNVLVNGNPSSGTQNRTKILEPYNGIALLAKDEGENDLLKVTGEKVKEIFRMHDVVYVYTDTIDSQSEKAGATTLDNCEKGIEDIIAIVKKLASGNFTNMIVTADHGFLYQDTDIDTTQTQSIKPSKSNVWQAKARFAIGGDLPDNEAYTTFTSRQIGLSNDSSEGVTIQVPKALQRMRIQGTRNRFVHGGASLQEIVVPVLHVNKGRTAEGDAQPVEFHIVKQTNEITTGQLTLDIVQDNPVIGRNKPRTIYVSLQGEKPDGTWKQISNEEVITLNRTSANIADRHYSATLVLTDAAGKFNNQYIRLTVREKTSGTGMLSSIPEKETGYKLRRGAMSSEEFLF